MSSAPLPARAKIVEVSDVRKPGANQKCLIQPQSGHAQVAVTDRLTLSADAAWLPYTSFSNLDTHWLRINEADGFTGPIHEDGTGHNGYQLEAILSYLVTPSFSVGAGVRYWYMQTSGIANFVGNSIGTPGEPQAIKYTTDRYGGFIQGAFKF